MKIVAISDTHNHQVELPEGDVLLVAGDITSTGTPNQIALFNNYLTQQAEKFKHKPLLIAGNHDFLFEKDRSHAEVLLSSAVYLEDQLFEIEGIRIYGSPWTPRFFNWAFMKDRGKSIRERWELIPDGIDVLMTHGPPMGILDYCGEHVGCADLLDVVTKRLSKPPHIHIFGHIHEGHGNHIGGNTWFLNVSICDGAYRPVNPVTVFEI